MRRPDLRALWDSGGWIYVVLAAVVAFGVWRVIDTGHESIGRQVQRIADELSGELEVSAAGQRSGLRADVVCARPHPRVFACRAYEPSHQGSTAALTTYDLRTCAQGGWHAATTRPASAAFPRRVSYEDGNEPIDCPASR